MSRPLTTNDLPSLKERCLLEGHALHKSIEEHGQPQHKRREATGEVREPEHWRLGEHVLALEVYELLYLRQGSNLPHGAVMEIDEQGGRAGVVDRRGQGGEGCGDLVAKEQGDATEMTVILGLETDLDLLVLVQDSLGGVR